MALNKTTKRLIAARRPFSVVEIKNDPSITNVNGKQSAYNLVGKNGSGIAEFGCDELAALWFCEAANRYADEIASRRSTTPHSEKDYNSAKLCEALATIRKRLVAAYESEAAFMRYSPNKPLVDLIDSALADPPRNCDRLSAEECKRIFAAEMDVYLPPEATDNDRTIATIVVNSVIDTLYAPVQEGVAK